MSDIPEAEMRVRSLPGRSLVYVRPHELGLEALCDCATTTILTIDPDEAAQVTETRDIPFTCEGCLSVHWLTFVPREVSGD